MSADCCTNSYDLGCVTCAQKNLKTPYVAEQDGVFVVTYKYRDTSVAFEIQGVKETLISLPLNGLNENFVHYAYITDPDGVRVVFEGHDCFRFRTVPSRVGEPVDDTPAESCPFVVNIYLDGELEETTEELNPCEDNEITIHLTLS